MCDGNCPECEFLRCKDIPKDIVIFSKNFDNEIKYNLRMKANDKIYSDIRKNRENRGRIIDENREAERYKQAIKEVQQCES